MDDDYRPPATLAGLAAGHFETAGGRVAGGNGTPLTRNTVRVVVVDEDHHARELIASLIAADPGLEMVGMAADAAAAGQLAAATVPDVAVIDVRVPGDGAATTALVHASSPATAVIAFSAHDDEPSVMSMLRAGALGYLVKGAPAHELLDGIHRAARNESALSGQVTNLVVDRLSAGLRDEFRASSTASELRSQVLRYCNGDGVTILFQPILELSDLQPVGWEALARFDAPAPPGHASWFDAADTAGVGRELDLTLVDLAGKEFAACEQPGYLAINIGPATFTSPAALRAIVSIPADDLVVEITEQAPIVDYQHATMQRGAFEAQGVRIAVDDAGAGFASTRHILELDPDIIKLDMSITQRVDHSLTFRTAAVGLLSLARAGNAQLVAEGVETPTQLAALRDLGVEYAQGFLLGRPAPLR